MRVQLTERLRKDYAAAPRPVQRAFDKQLRLLEQNFQHPSLRAKKYHGGEDLWQARATGSWRFYFRITSDTYRIIALTPHPK